MCKDIADLADGNDIATRSCRKIEDGLARRRHRVVPAIMRPGISGLRSPERPRDDPSDIEGLQKLTGDLADRIKPIQPEFILVCRDLKDAIGRCVTDWFPGSNVIITQ